MKRFRFCIAALVLAAVFTACGEVQDTPAQTANLQAPPGQGSTLAAQTTRQAGVSEISMEKAREIALDHAGCTPFQVTFTKGRREDDDGFSKYVVKFEKDGWEYAYDIHAGTGVILESQRRRIDPPTATQPLPSSAPGGISLEQAKEIALADAGLAGQQVKFEKAERENDGGAAKYELGFEAGGREYEYEIHAGTGAILKSEGKREPQTTRPGEIGLEKAKGIALADAGLAAGKAEFDKAERERDDGVTVYEIEFKADGWEYKYEIHAGTGVILKRDRDRD